MQQQSTMSRKSDVAPSLLHQPPARAPSSTTLSKKVTSSESTSSLHQSPRIPLNRAHRNLTCTRETPQATLGLHGSHAHVPHQSAVDHVVVHPRDRPFRPTAKTHQPPRVPVQRAVSYTVAPPKEKSMKPVSEMPSPVSHTPIAFPKEQNSRFAGKVHQSYPRTPDQNVNDTIAPAKEPLPPFAFQTLQRPSRTFVQCAANHSVVPLKKAPIQPAVKIQLPVVLSPKVVNHAVVPMNEKPSGTALKIQQLAPSIPKCDTNDILHFRENRFLSEQATKHHTPPAKEKRKPNISEWGLLSPHVLFRVFWFAQQGDPSALGQIRGVCKTWNEVALDHPALWSQLTIMDEERMAGLKAKTFVEHSRNSLMTVVYKQSSLRSGVRCPTWEVLKGSAERWESFALECMTEEAIILQICSVENPMHKLTHLSLTVTKIFDSDDESLGLDVGILENKMPSIRSLALNVFRLPQGVSIPWMFNLKIISIVDQFNGTRNEGKPISGNELLHFIAACPTLEEFSFKSERCLSWYANDLEKIQPEMTLPRTIQLPYLYRVEFTAHVLPFYTFFENVSLPNVSSLKLSPRPTYVPGGHEGFYRCIRDTILKASQLQSIQIDGFDPLIFLQSSKGCLQNLKSLHLRFIPNPNGVLNALSGPFKDYRGQPYWNLPSLDELNVKTFVHEFPFDRFSAMTEKRYAASQAGKELMALRTFTVGDQLLLWESSEGKTRPYKHSAWYPSIRKENADIEKGRRRNTNFAAATAIA